MKEEPPLWPSPMAGPQARFRVQTFAFDDSLIGGDYLLMSEHFYSE
jgi:hypothetical protein